MVNSNTAKRKLIKFFCEYPGILALRLVALVTILSACIIHASGQTTVLKKVEPASWWVGMKNTQLQILLYGDKLADWNVDLNYPGVSISKTLRVSNPNYIFLYVNIAASTQPGDLKINFRKDKKQFSHTYALKSRQRDPLNVKGFGPGDFIYLLMPDRFSNGDTTNDVVTATLEKTIDRKQMYKRHGGDLQGVINHLDYLGEMGVTSIWLNPVWTNDQPEYSYHGYAATDLYAVDPRYGGMETYLEFVNAAHSKKMKVIMDYIYNHVGSECWWIKDLPSPDWVNQWPEFTRCNYRPSSLSDPYGSAYDRKLNSDGWFDKHMPDLNQRNELLADYLIQNTIWWVEYTGIDAFRIDTYPYPDNDFMNTCIEKVYEEYPNINIVGETWEQTVAHVAYWQKNTPIRTDGKINQLPSETDFTLYFAIKDGLKEPFGWLTGLRRIYYTLAQDMLFGDPYQNVIFLDNHDLSRIYSELGEDFAKWKLAITMLMTTRGVPQLYYGTEILMKNFSNPDGLVREDFPGGWASDSANKFIAAGRTPKENEAFNYVKTLGNWRKNTPVAYEGKLMQFVPDDDMYVYFRYNDTQSIMVIINSAAAEKTLNTNRFSERMNGFKNGKDIISGNTVTDLSAIKIPAQTAMVIELRR
jgi:glycosidase